MVMFLNAKAIGNRDRLFFCEHGCAGIAFFLSIVPVLVIARQIQIDLAFLQLTFLYTEYICIYLIEKVHKAFSHAGTQTVYIPGYEFFHNCFSFCCMATPPPYGGESSCADNTSPHKAGKLLHSTAPRSEAKYSPLFWINQSGLRELINMGQHLQILCSQIFCHSQVHIQVIAAVFWRCAWYFPFKVTDKFIHFYY